EPAHPRNILPANGRRDIVDLDGEPPAPLPQRLNRPPCRCGADVQDEGRLQGLTVTLRPSGLLTGLPHEDETVEVDVPGRDHLVAIGAPLVAAVQRHGDPEYRVRLRKRRDRNVEDLECLNKV